MNNKRGKLNFWLFLHFVYLSKVVCLIWVVSFACLFFGGKGCAIVDLVAYSECAKLLVRVNTHVLRRSQTTKLIFFNIYNVFFSLLVGLLFNVFRNFATQISQLK